MHLDLWMDMSMRVHLPSDTGEARSARSWLREIVSHPTWVLVDVYVKLPQMKIT